MIPKVLVTPFGGHATIHITTTFKRRGMRFHPRLDYPFSLNIQPYDIHSVPDWDEPFSHYMRKGMSKRARWKEWKKRTGELPDRTKTINELLLDFIDRTNNYVLLFGKHSLGEQWLTNNNIEALCMVRHPLYAYVSLMKHRHPQWGKVGGGVTSSKCAKWYADSYNRVLDDFLESGNPIVRYEHLVSDCRNHGLNAFASFIQPVWRPQNKLTVQLSEAEEVLREETRAYFNEIWPQW